MFKSGFKILILGLLFQIFSVSSQAQAQFDPSTGTVKDLTIGTVLLSVGKVWLFQEGRDKRKISKLVKIVPFDILKTEEKSVVKIKMIDDTIIDIGPNSTFNFKEFEFRDKNDRKSTYSLVEGQLRALIVNKSKKNGDLKIEAQKVSMGIRGTEVLAKVALEESGPISEIALLDGHGELDISQLGVQQKLISIRKGQYFSSQAVGPRAPASESLRNLTPEQINKFQRDSKNGDLEVKEAVFLDQVAFNEAVEITPTHKERLPASPEPEPVPDMNISTDQLKLENSDPTPWYEILKKQQNTLPNKRSHNEEDYLPLPTKQRKPAGMGPTSKKFKCNYKSMCIKHTPYRFPGNQVMGLCTETRIIKYPENCQ